MAFISSADEFGIARLSCGGDFAVQARLSTRPRPDGVQSTHENAPDNGGVEPTEYRGRVVESTPSLAGRRPVPSRSRERDQAKRRVLERAYPLLKQAAELLELEAIEPLATEAKRLRQAVGASLASVDVVVDEPPCHRSSTPSSTVSSVASR